MITKRNPWIVNRTEFQSPYGNFVSNPYINDLIVNVTPNIKKNAPKTIKNFEKTAGVLKTLILVMLQII